MDKKYIKYINTLFVILPMTLIMAFVGVTRNLGFPENWLSKVFNAWIVMFPVAYGVAFFIIPLANRLTEKFVSKLK